MEAADYGAEHHNLGEFGDALAALDAAGWERLRQLARNRCRARRPGEEEEILQEAITRVLEGRRPWSKGEDLHAFLSGVMRSIASEKPKVGFGRYDAGLDTVPDPICETAGADGDLLQKQVKERYLGLFQKDEELMVVEGRFEGMNKNDFLSLFDGDETKYQTVCRGVRRMLNKHPELRGLIDG